MKANEFRIGNYVFSKIIEDTIKLSALLESQDLQIEPIPLTEEWLLKFGFEKIDYVSSPRYELEDFYIGYNENGFYLQIESQIQSNYFRYIHQLQNLFFALTGEELKIIL